MALAYTTLLVTLAFLLAASCYSQCPSGPITVEVAGTKGSVLVQALEEGGYLRIPCAKVANGYVGDIEVQCLGSSMTVDPWRCLPKSCPAGMSVLVAIDAATKVVEVALSSQEEHGGQEAVPCGKMVDGYIGHIIVDCKLGAVTADGSGCHLPFSDAKSAWRVLNVDHLPGTWRVFELSFHTTPDCSKGAELSGQPIASSEDRAEGGPKSLAFDSKPRTGWAARCDTGCPPFTAWIGISLPKPSDMVRCVQLLQSQVTCCGTPRVRLDVWTGQDWQQVHVWGTQGMTRWTEGFRLPAPISCYRGKPEGSTITHNCDGPPVVGLQSGDQCVARCRPGYYGEASTFTCTPSGSFEGTNPQCYELRAFGQLAMLASIAIGLVFLGCQYQFWCMYKKDRLSLEMIPAPLFGRWLEQDGQTIWETILATKDEESKRSPFDVPAEKKSKRKSADGTRKATKKADATMANAIQVLQDQLEDDEDDAINGFCSPCEDPDICCEFMFCPICRQADTWHTIRSPPWMTYWRVFFAYVLCPFCWPCLSFYGRLRVRRAFNIDLEPHRDCLFYCVCCCCCGPCAACQEARLVDATIMHHHCIVRQQEIAASGIDRLLAAP